ncbi:MAG TPA: hypothetical protein VIK84_06650 [Haloplasmataceae bacterium]
MKTIITNIEENKYNKRIYLLLPIIVGLIFAVTITLIYFVFYLIFPDTLFQWKFTYSLLAFILGVLDGFTTILLTIKNNNKKHNYYSNLERKGKNDMYIPAILEKGFLKNIKGVILLTKDSLDFVAYQMRERKTLFSYPISEVSYEITREENKTLKRILTLTKGTNIMTVTVNEQKYRFILPCLPNIIHRLESHKVISIKKDYTN